VIAADLEGFLRRAGCAFREVDVLPGDLSQRRYFRVALESGASLLAAHYPEELRASMARFEMAQSWLAAAGVRVPAIQLSDRASGWMLVEDLGPRTLFEAAADGRAAHEARFLAAVDIAGRIAGLDRDRVVELGNPPLDGDALRRELDPTFEFLFDPGGLAELPGERQELALALDELCRRIADDPLVPCHRDFMARNLVPLADGGLAVIDFQDLRLGPPAYDLAALLNDSFFPDEALEDRLLPAGRRAGRAREQYARTVVQRALKAAGTFARFAARGRPRHLPLIAPTLGRAAVHLAALPETAGAFAPLRQWFALQPARDPFC
jgi:aminoglycoside/choline kinase family phosphotransferase